MSRCIYINGSYRSDSEAVVHAEDRGFQFADSVYEVIEVRDRALVDATRHLDRLHRSLSELGIASPMSRPGLLLVIAQVIRRNRVRDGMVYMQVSRGAAPRDFAFPDPNHTPPTLVVLSRSMSRQKRAAQADKGIAVITRPDPRWNRCDIKTVMLLPACLAKDDAHRHGASEAWFVDADGYVTEGASSNAWIVTNSGEVVTRKADHNLLAGITRATTADTVEALGLAFVERKFTVADAIGAAEVFITSATNLVMPVVKIDDQTIGRGVPGARTMQLRQAFHDHAQILSLKSARLP